MSARSGSAAWAVGNYNNNGVSATLILHWNGTAWTQVKSPTAPPYTDFGLNGVSAVSGSAAWAVGNYNSYYTPGASRTLVLHWNGTSWANALTS